MPLDLSQLSKEDQAAVQGGDLSKVSAGGLNLLEAQLDPEHNPNQVANNIEQTQKIGSSLKQFVPKSLQDLIGTGSSMIAGHVRGLTAGYGMPDAAEKAIAPNREAEDIGTIEGSPAMWGAMLGAGASPGLVGRAVSAGSPTLGKILRVLGTGAAMGAGENIAKKMTE